MTKAISSLLALAVTLGASTAFADENPPIPATPPPATQPAPAATGQWVYTTQNGWLWMPYGPSYTYVNPDSSVAYEYVYYPAFGWHWVASPWVLGIGPSPFWGVHGYARFAWHAHPWVGGRHYAGAGRQMHAVHVGARGFHAGGRGHH